MTTRRRMTKSFAPLALTASAVTVLAGCGASAGQGDENTVDWWGWAPEGTVAEQYIAAFEEEHPDITVNFREVPFADYVNVLRLGVSADSGPDVFNLQPGEITTRFGGFGADLTDRLVDEFGDDWQDRLIGSSYEQFTVDDSQVGLPVQLAASGNLWYNKTVLDEAGLQPPETYDEWIDVCGQLQEAGTSCLIQGASEAWINLDVFISILNDLAPGAIYDAIEGDLAFTDPDIVEAFTVWQEMFENGIMQEGAAGLATYPEGQTDFALGEGAFIALGTFAAGEMMTEEGLARAQQVDELQPNVILPMSFPDINGDGEHAQTFGGPDYGLAVSSRSNAQDAAWTFVSWLSSEEGGQQLIADQKFIPSLAGTELDDAGLVAPDLQQSALQQLPDYLENISGAREIPYADVKVALGDALSALAVGQSTPEDAAETVEQASAATDRG